MSFKNNLDKRKESPIAIFHRFRTTNQSAYKFYLFVEGYEDLSLYSKYIENIDRSSIKDSKTYICFGKNNMDKIISMFYSSDLTNRNVLFIRDSDFDRFLGKTPTGPHVFLTCGYAVENYVCTEENISSYVRGTFGIDSDEIDVTDLCRRHTATVEKLFSWLSRFVGAVLFANLEGRPLDLNRFDVRKYYSIIYNNSDLPSEIVDEWIDTGLTEQDFNQESQALGDKYVEQQAYQWLRGKYLLESACEFLKIEHSRLIAAHKNGDLRQFNRKINPDFSPNAVFERLSSHSTAPEPLQEILLRTVAA